MSEHPTARFIQHEVPKRFMLGNPAALIPKRVTGWWGDATDDDISDFTFGVSADCVNDPAASHGAKMHWI